MRRTTRRISAALGWVRPVSAAIAVTLLLSALTPIALAVAADRKYPTTDALQNVSPKSEVPGSRLLDRHPLSNYQLDYYVKGPSAGIDAGGPKIDTGLEQTPGLVMQTIANALWQVCTAISVLVIRLFTWAFSVDLLKPDSTSGPLGQVADAITNDIYGADGTGILGREWMAVGVLIAGMWAMWKGLVQRRYAETFSALGLSVLCMFVALAFVLQPRETIAQPIQWTNQAASSFLALAGGSNTLNAEYQTSEGGADGGLDNNGSGYQADAKTKVADSLFQRLIYDPWVVLEFGGLKHCTKGENELIAPSDAAAEGASCIDHKVATREGGAYRGGYAERFLAFNPDSTARKREATALRDGKVPDDDGGGGLGGLAKGVVGSPLKAALLPTPAGPFIAAKEARSQISKIGGGEEISAKDQFNGWKFDARDQPASDLQQATTSGSGQRLAMVALVFLGSIGAWLLIGGASIAVIFAQMLLLVLLAFAPVMLVVGMFPGRGHQVFGSWLSRMGTQLAKKVIYAFILAICLTISGALLGAVGDDWLLAFVVQALFYWTLFLYRNDLASMLVQATTGGRFDTDYNRKLQSAYYTSKTVGGPLRSMRRRGARGGQGGAPSPEAVPAAAKAGGAAGAVSVAALSLGKLGLDRFRDGAEREKNVGQEQSSADPVAAGGVPSDGKRATGGDETSGGDSHGGTNGDAPMAPIGRSRHDEEPGVSHDRNGSNSHNGSKSNGSNAAAATTVPPRPRSAGAPQPDRPSAAGDGPTPAEPSAPSSAPHGSAGNGSSAPSGTSSESPERTDERSPLARSLDDENDPRSRRVVPRRRPDRRTSNDGGDES